MLISFTVVCVLVLRCYVNGSVCLVYCVFVNYLVKQFAICFGVVAIFLLNVMEVFSVCGGALLDIPCGACDPNERLDAPSIGFVLCFCMSDVHSSFKSLRAGSQVFALLMLFFV